MTDQPPNKPTGILLYLPPSDGPGPIVYQTALRLSKFLRLSLSFRGQWHNQPLLVYRNRSPTAIDEPEG